MAVIDLGMPQQWSADVASSGEALTIMVNGCKVAVNNNAGRDVIYHTISALLRPGWICAICRF